MKQNIAKISIDSQVLFNRLEKMKKGDFVSYDELTALIDKDVQNSARYNLTTARNKMLSEHGVVFEPVHNEGLNALTDEENALSSGAVALKRIRKTAHRAVKRLTAVEFDGLSNEAKVAHNTGLGMAGAFLAITKSKTVKRVEVEARNTGEIISLNKTIELFK